MSNKFSALCVSDPSSPSGYRTASYDEIMRGAKQALSHRVRKGAFLDSPGATRNFLTVTLGGREFESFCCLFVDNRHRLIEFVEMFRGTIDGASVHPREVVKEALKRNAAAVILVHFVPRHIMQSIFSLASRQVGCVVKKK